MAHEMGQRQRWAWIGAAWSVIAAACLCGFGWGWVLLGAAAAALYYIYMEYAVPSGGLVQVYGALGRPGMLLLAISGLWAAVLMSWSAGKIQLAFPGVRAVPELSLILLALAAWSSRRGIGAGAACSGVLCLILLVLYGLLAAFAVPDLKWAQLRPWGTWQQGVESWGVCLLPAVLWFLPVQRRRRRPCRWPAVLLPAASAVLAAWTSGILSPQLAAARPSPLYDLAQSVSILGVMERIEPMLSVAMTMGLYALLSAFACTIQKIGQTIRPWGGYGVLAAVLSGIGLYWAESLNTIYVVVGTAVLWVLIPLLVLGIRNKTGGKKRK